MDFCKGQLCLELGLCDDCECGRGCFPVNRVLPYKRCVSCRVISIRQVHHDKRMFLHTFLTIWGPFYALEGLIALDDFGPP